MIINPFDFVVLTGLGFSDGPLVLQEDFYHNRAHLFEFFAPVMRNTPYGDNFPYTILFTLMREVAGWPANTTD